MSSASQELINRGKRAKKRARGGREWCVGGTRKGPAAHPPGSGRVFCARGHVYCSEVACLLLRNASSTASASC